MPQLTGPLKFRSFWPSPTLTRTGPLWLSSSPSWSFIWRVKDSTPLKRFKRNCSGYFTQFQKGTSRDASKHGRNAGTTVFMQKGSTLKVMEEFNIQGKQISFYKYCPGTFGYTLVHCICLLFHCISSVSSWYHVYQSYNLSCMRNYYQPVLYSVLMSVTCVVMFLSITSPLIFFCFVLFHFQFTMWAISNSILHQ